MQNSNKVVLLSGGTGGIGEVVLNYLANNNYTILLPVRNINKGNDLINEICSNDKSLKDSFIIFECDLASFKSVNNFLSKIRTSIISNNSKLVLLITNAGIIENKYIIT